MCKPVVRVYSESCGRGVTEGAIQRFTSVNLKRASLICTLTNRVQSGTDKANRTVGGQQCPTNVCTSLAKP